MSKLSKKAYTIRESHRFPEFKFKGPKPLLRKGPQVSFEQVQAALARSKEQQAGKEVEAGDGDSD